MKVEPIDADSFLSIFLERFYRPTMYKEAPTKELTEEEKILAASGRSDMIATAAPEMIAGTSIAAI